MAKPLTFAQMVKNAEQAVPGIAPKDASKKLKEDPNTLVVDVRDAADLATSGVIPGSVNISYGALTYKADQELPEAYRDKRVQDRARPIISTCDEGPLGALGAKLLKDMGFQNVHYLAGGVLAWKKEGLPTEAPTK